MNIPSLIIGIIIGVLITTAGFIYYFVMKVAKEAKHQDPYKSKPKI